MVRPHKIHESRCESDRDFQIISFVEGPFAGVPFKINEINITDDGLLEYDYDLYIADKKDFDKPSFDTEVGQFLLECLTAVIDEDLSQLHDNVNIVEEDE